MSQINFGFLIVPLQMLDLAGPMDLLSNLDKSVMGRFGQTEEIKQKAIDIKFHYIGPDMYPVNLTGNAKLQPTTTIKDCPKLDYLLIGGPFPDYALNLPAEMGEFIRQRSKEVKALFTTCTGGLVAAAAGVLDGVEATTNHMSVPQGRESFPKVKWNDSMNWVADGKFWTAAGAIAGADMMAHWVKQTFGDECYYFSTSILEYQPRNVQGKFVESMNGRLQMVPGEAA